MSCSLKFLLPVMILAVPVAALAQSQPRIYPNLGTPLSQADIQSFDRMIGPEGKELPPGRGTSKEGEAIFAKRCEICHGKEERGKRAPPESGDRQSRPALSRHLLR
jgi:cytochrome c